MSRLLSNWLASVGLLVLSCPWLIVVAADAKDAETANVPKVLRVGSPQTYPPIEFRDPDTGKVIGVSSELLHLVAERLGMRLEWVQCDYAALIGGVMASRFDIASGGISDQPERETKLDFVNYLKVDTAILVRTADFHTYGSIDDFSGRRVAYTFGARKTAEAVERASERLLRLGKAPIVEVVLGNSADAKMQLDLGRAEGYLNEVPTLTYLMHQQPDKYRMVEDGRHILSRVVTSWGVAKDRRKLRDDLQSAMVDLLKEGIYHRVLQKWRLSAAALPEITVNQPLLEPGGEKDGVAVP